MHHLLADAAASFAAPQPIQVLVIPGAVDLRELEAGGIHQRHEDQRAANRRGIQLFDDMGQNQRWLDFQPARASLDDQCGSRRRAIDDMQRICAGIARASGPSGSCRRLCCPPPLQCFQVSSVFSFLKS